MQFQRSSKDLHKILQGNQSAWHINITPLVGKHLHIRMQKNSDSL